MVTLSLLSGDATALILVPLKAPLVDGVQYGCVLGVAGAKVAVLGPDPDWIVTLEGMTEAGLGPDEAFDVDPVLELGV